MVSCHLIAFLRNSSSRCENLCVWEGRIPTRPRVGAEPEGRWAPGTGGWGTEPLGRSSRTPRCPCGRVTRSRAEGRPPPTASAPLLALSLSAVSPSCRAGSQSHSWSLSRFIRSPHECTVASASPPSFFPSEQLLICYQPPFTPRMAAPGGQELCLTQAGAWQTRVEWT